MPAEHRTYLIETCYKGHPNSFTVTLPEGQDLDKYLEKRGYRAVVATHAPGEWHYEPETGCAVPGAGPDDHAGT